MQRGEAQSRLSPTMAGSPTSIRHVRPVRPLLFTARDPEWDMSESHRHKRLCELLYQLLRACLGDEACVGSDQFVYYDASSSRKKCSPDGFVKLGVPAEPIFVWKVWEKGAPELCVEILSPSDTEEKLTLPQKLSRFHTMGVSEVVTFDVDADVGQRIRAWDRIEGDLVERVVEDERTPCRTLGLWFVVAPYVDEERFAVDNLASALRLSRDAQGTDLVLAPDESARLKTRNEKARADQAEQARASTEVENERLRAELARRTP